MRWRCGGARCCGVARWWAELLDGDGEQVGGDVGDDHVGAAHRHLRVPVRVAAPKPRPSTVATAMRLRGEVVLATQPAVVEELVVMATPPTGVVRQRQVENLDAVV